MASCWIRGKCIGRGSFGTVNVAVDKSNGNVFAVKSVDQSACLSAQIESLENEITTLRSLSSNYIVKYLGDDVSYESLTTSYRNLHMEYLPGGTVADVAKNEKTPYVEEKILRSHTYCVVSALRYLHSNGVAHCDVKGKNVLVGSNLSHCKLADFGSAKRISDETDRCRVSISPRGSPLWMAPEVVRGEYQGPESDVWSLGCTIVEMVTGKPAWDDSGIDTLSRIGLSYELPSIPTQLSELGRDFVEKCLRRERSDRWSCDQLLQHPFLLSASQNDAVTESSPRCVLDCVNSEFEEDEDFENSEVSARERIGKLACSRGAFWESDGWLAVRNYEKEGTTKVYSDLPSIENETAGTSSVFCESIWIRPETEARVNSEIQKSGGCEFHFRCGGGCLSCRDYGWRKGEIAADSGGMGFYWMYHIIFNYCLKIFRYNLILLLLYGSILYILCLLVLASIYACDWDPFCPVFGHEVSSVFTSCWFRSHPCDHSGSCLMLFARVVIFEKAQILLVKINNIIIQLDGVHFNSEFISITILIRNI